MISKTLVYKVTMKIKNLSVNAGDFSKQTEDLLIEMHRSIDSFTKSTSRGLHINFFVVLSSANYGVQVKQTGPAPDVYQLKAPWCLIM